MYICYYNLYIIGLYIMFLLCYKSGSVLIVFWDRYDMIEIGVCD